jgi:hypothetical protein
MKISLVNTNGKERCSDHQSLVGRIVKSRSTREELQVAPRTSWNSLPSLNLHLHVVCWINYLDEFMWRLLSTLIPTYIW